LVYIVAAPNSKVNLPRCPTGIEGLDNILDGGIPRGCTVLLTGSCGTGKTTLGLEYLVRGALAGEKSMFLSVTEASERIIENLSTFEFFDKKIIDEGRLVFIDIPILYEKLGLTKQELTPEDIDLLIGAIVDLASTLKIQRLVLDSVTSVCFRIRHEEKIRDFILKLGKSLSDIVCTTLLVSEIGPQADRYSLYGVEENIADGVILLGNMQRHGDLLRTLQIIKVRGAQHSRAQYVIEITPLGIFLAPFLKGGGRESTNNG
jgi:KaiC/GvpD/RAD55 family RecA-like ATPase